MSGHSPATRALAIRTGSWLAPEARPNDATPCGARVWRDRFGVCRWLRWMPLRRVMRVRKSLRIRRAVRHLPYPELELPLQINGGQYAPVAWSDIAGWSEDDHLAAYKAFRVSCRPISAQTNAAGRSEGARHLAARSLPHRQRPRTVRRRRRQRLSSRSIFFPCAFRGLAKARALSPAITSPSSTARGRRTRSTRCRSIAGRPICSSAAPRRARPACPTRARCSARSAAASWCPITIAPRSRMARLPAAGSKSAG